MSKTVIPVVLNDDKTQHKSLLAGEVLPVGSLPISTDKQNLLGADEEGLILTGEMLLSEQENNPIINNIDNRLFLRVKDMLAADDKILSVADNLLYADLSLVFNSVSSKLTLCGKDNTVISELILPVAPGLPTLVEILQDFTPPAPEGYIESPYPEGTYLHMQFQTTGGEPTDVYLDLSKLADIYTAGFAVSIENNVVSVVPDKLLNPHEKLLTVRNGTINAQPGLAFDKETETLTLTGVGGAELASVKVPVSASGLSAGMGVQIDDDIVSVKLSAASDNALTVTENGLYVKEGINADSVGGGLIIGADGKLTVDIDTLAALLADKLPLGISGDENNALKLGSDDKPYFPGDLGKL